MLDPVDCQSSFSYSFIHVIVIIVREISSPQMRPDRLMRVRVEESHSLANFKSFILKCHIDFQFADCGLNMEFIIYFY